LRRARRDVYTPTMIALGDAARAKFAEHLQHGGHGACDDEKLPAFGPIVLDLLPGSAELPETTDDRS